MKMKIDPNFGTLVNINFIHQYTLAKNNYFYYNNFYFS